MFYTYMVRCKDNSIYSGYTNNIDKRIETHNSGKGAKYTRARLPVVLQYYEIYETKSEAMKREVQFKRLSHSQKEELIRRNKNETNIK